MLFPANESIKPAGGKLEPVGKSQDECGPVVYIDYARFELREYKSTSVLTAAELQRCVAVDWMVDKADSGMTITTRELVVMGRPAVVGYLDGAENPQLLLFQPDGAIARLSAWNAIPVEDLVAAAESFRPIN